MALIYFWKGQLTKVFTFRIEPTCIIDTLHISRLLDKPHNEIILNSNEPFLYAFALHLYVKFQIHNFHIWNFLSFHASLWHVLINWVGNKFCDYICHIKRAEDLLNDFHSNVFLNFPLSNHRKHIFLFFFGKQGNLLKGIDNKIVRT